MSIMFLKLRTVQTQVQARIQVQTKSHPTAHVEEGVGDQAVLFALALPLSAWP